MIKIADVTHKSCMIIECRNQRLPVEICISKDCYAQDFTPLIMSWHREYNITLSLFRIHLFIICIIVSYFMHNIYLLRLAIYFRINA